MSERAMPVGETARAPEGARPRVVVVGGGFGGLCGRARAARRAPVDVTLVDRRNFHLFQPLAYQVATGALSPAEIAAPLRAVFKRQANARVLLAEVTGFDLERARGALAGTGDRRRAGRSPYDTLVVAGGSRYSYFGHDEWRAVRARAEVARGRARHPQPDPQRVRGGRGCERRGRAARAGSPSSSSAPARPASRWRARSPSSRARRCAATSARSTRAPRACCSSRPPTACSTGFPAVALAEGGRGAASALGVTPLVGHTVVDVGPDSVAIQDAGRRGRAGRRAHGDLGGRRDASELAASLADAGGRSRSTGPAASPSSPT